MDQNSKDIGLHHGDLLVDVKYVDGLRENECATWELGH